jgi:hypothetical protein
MRSLGLAFLTWLVVAGCGQAFSAAPSHDGGSGSDASTDGVSISEGGSDAPGDALGSTDSGPRPCSTHLLTDSQNCGACKHVCVTGACVAGLCPVTTISQTFGHPTALAADIIASGPGNVFVADSDCSGASSGGSVQVVYPGGVVATIASEIPCTFPPGITLAVNATSIFWAASGTGSTTMAYTVAGSPTEKATTITPPITAGRIVALAADDVYLYAGSDGGDFYYVVASHRNQGHAVEFKLGYHGARRRYRR